MHTPTPTDTHLHTPTPLRTHGDPALVPEGISTGSMGRERAEQPAFLPLLWDIVSGVHFSHSYRTTRKKKQLLLSWNERGNPP